MLLAQESPCSPQPGSTGSYLRFAEDLVRGGVLSDPWLDGQARFVTRPLVLSRAQLDALARAAEEVTAVYDQVVRLCLRHPELHERYFQPSPWQRRLFAHAAPLWHGIARADVFFTRAGISVCELNCDTPSGEAEAVILGRMARAADPARFDPNAGLERRMVALVERMAGRPLAHRLAPPLSVGVVYPTELTEDLSMIALYRRWIESRGGHVTLGSPFNLRRDRRGRITLLDQPIDLILRHYKTDWWCERRPLRDDEQAAGDALPLGPQLELLLSPGAPPVVNPLPSIVPQNKRSMALMWEEMGRFPAWAQAAIWRYVPPTFRLEALPRTRVRAEQQRWVLKSDYGCEGAEVVVGPAVSREEWNDALAHALPARFVVQRCFEPLVDDEGAATNYGVYLVSGVASGLLCRVQRGPTDRGARTVPALVETE